jgi:hypothetical protein
METATPQDWRQRQALLAEMAQMVADYPLFLGMPGMSGLDEPSQCDGLGADSVHAVLVMGAGAIQAAFDSDAMQAYLSQRSEVAAALGVPPSFLSRQPIDLRANPGLLNILSLRAKDTPEMGRGA